MSLHLLLLECRTDRSSVLCTARLAHFGGAFFISIFGQALDTFLLTMLLDNLVIRLLLLAHVCNERAVLPMFKSIGIGGWTIQRTLSRF